MGFAIFLLLIVVLVTVVTCMVAKEQKEREEDAARRIVPGIIPPPQGKRVCLTAMVRTRRAKEFLALPVNEMAKAWDNWDDLDVKQPLLLDRIVDWPEKFWNLYKEERDWLLEKMQACGCRSSDLFDEEMLKLRWPDMPDDFEPPGYRSDWVKETQEKLSDYGPSRDEDKKAGA